MEMEMTVPERYLDTITGDFAYDPIRLPLEQDPTQNLYNRKTLQTIWETKQRARNPYTRQWFAIKSVIPQTELRREMEHYLKLHSFPADTIIAEYSKVLAEGEMKRHLWQLHKSVVEKRTIRKDQWEKIWKKVNIVRLFCEFDFQNIRSFISVNGFKYLQRPNLKILEENEAKDAALDVAKEIVRTIYAIINGLRSHGEDSVGTFVKLGEIPKGQDMIFSIINLLNHVYRNSEGYMKIQTFILQVFSTVFDEITAKADIVHVNTIGQAVFVGYPCVMNILSQRDILDISNEDLNHGIAILRRVGAAVIESFSFLHKAYARALGTAVIICISREIDQRSKDMSGFTEAQLLEAQVQAQHNSEALERGVRLIRDIIMEETQLATYILGRVVDIIKELLHMFEGFCEAENEDDDEAVWDPYIFVCNCERSIELVQCFHYRIAQDGLEISEVISRKAGQLFDVEILRKFVRDRS